MRPHRTGIAALLVAAAVTVPCAAWYVAGSREAEREAERLAGRPRQEAQRTAARLADHLAVRLEALRDVESRRPFFHYQSHFHDPSSDCECASVTVSPLAQGPTDPVVSTYFQVDPAGALTLPTLGPAALRERTAGWVAAEARHLGALRAAAPALVAGLHGRAMDGNGSGGAPHGQGGRLPAGGECREEPVDLASWTINLALGIGGGEAAARARSGAPDAGGGESVVVEVGSFLWRTVVVGGAPSLVALREAITPVGSYTQGFVVAPAVLEGLLRGVAFPARWEPGPARDPLEAPILLDGAEWHVVVEASPAIAEAGSESRRVVARFRRTFAAGALAAALAGLGVVGLVRQTERVARDRARFAASAAHELRTPLAGMRMYGEMLAESLGHPERAEEYARRITAEADRLGRVVDNVMGYARLERGGASVRPAAGDLGETVRRAVEVLRPAVEREGATLRFDAAPGLRPARFDPDAVVRILQNLVDNAEKYARRGGDPVIDVAVGGGEAGVILSVADRGPGIPAALRDRLFEPFVRAEGSEGPAGLGLGLTLVRALAEAQGARVAFRDAEPHGAIFTVTFPAA